MKTKPKPPVASAPDKPNNLRLEWVEAGSLTPNPMNWRRHPPEQTAALKDVITDPQVGWAGALLFNSRTNRLIDGHARREVVPPGTLVPVLVGSWSEEAEKKILATLDPLAGLAMPDPEALMTLLGEVDFDSDSLKSIETMLREQVDDMLRAESEVNVIDDDPPAPPDEAFSKRGDVWLLGEHHRLMVGDSGSAEDVDRLLNGAKIHLACCDPPYGVKVEPRSGNAIAAGNSSFPESKPDTRTHHQKFDEARQGKKKRTDDKLRAKDRALLNDFVSDDEFARLLRAWFGNISRVLLPGRGFFIWGGYANLSNYPAALKECGLYFSQGIVWDKGHPVLTRKDFMGAFEFCFYGWRDGAAHVYLGPNNIPDLWHVKKINPQSMEHLTQKPVELAARAITYSSRPGENVLDLFGGSGSTLIAAEQLGRHAYLMELDALYADLVIDRFQRFTSKAAVHAETGEPFPKPPPAKSENMR